MLTLTAVAVAVTLVGHGDPVPRRPKLDAKADTNDAWAYYNYARANLTDHPDRAADAFYWAIRLSPGIPDTYYGRMIALKLKDPRKAINALYSRSTSAEEMRYDSLRTAAVLLNPFLFRGSFDRQFFDKLIDWASGGDERLSNMYSGDPIHDAWIAYSRSDFRKAAGFYADAIKRWPKAYWLHSDRAEVFVHGVQFDSARAELKQFIEQWHKEDDKELVRYYESKAFGEYCLAHLELKVGRVDAAREAFQRALTEDLSFHMAHVGLGELYLAQRDTAAALNEFELAIQIRGNDVPVRYRYALMLIGANKLQDASRELEATIALEPYFAFPYFYLARIYDLSDMPEEATKYYNAFITRAARNMQEAAWAKNRLVQLSTPAAPAATPAPASGT